jgi:hypothetical protein
LWQRDPECGFESMKMAAATRAPVPDRRKCAAGVAALLTLKGRCQGAVIRGARGFRDAIRIARPKKASKRITTVDNAMTLR